MEKNERAVVSGIDPDMSRNGGCRRCGECCKHYALGIDTRDFPPALMAWFHARGVKVRNDWIIIPTICPHLDYDEVTGQAMCDIHNIKPTMCRNYPVSGDWTPDGCVYHGKV